MADRELTDLIIYDESPERLATLASAFRDQRQMSVHELNDFWEDGGLLDQYHYKWGAAYAGNRQIHDFVETFVANNPRRRLVIYEITSPELNFEPEDVAANITQLKNRYRGNASANLTFMKIGDPKIPSEVDNGLVQLFGKKGRVTKIIEGINDYTNP